MLQIYVSSTSDVSGICYSCFIWMLQKYIRDVAHVTYIINVAEACCKHLFKIFHLFQIYVECFDLDVTYISHICCNSIFQVFYLFDLFVAANVFMLQITSVLSGCCIFSHVCYESML
jgi:hypothetical protein